VPVIESSFEKQPPLVQRLKALASFLLASFLYTMALVLIVSALRAQQIADGQLTINFEYRAF
jgi:hypothetical protein